MRRLKVKELVAEAYTHASEMPPATAGLIQELATRLDVTFVVLMEVLERNKSGGVQ